MMLAKQAGHRVVLVLATRGEQGEPVDGVLAEAEELGDRRSAETQRSAEIIGADRVEFLGYEDSGMIDTESNRNPRCFWQANLSEASERFAKILDSESADLLTVYDSNGGYGHPDHIQVHRVGKQAAEMLGNVKVFESTMNRTKFLDQIETNIEMLTDGGIEVAELEERRKLMSEGTFGMTEDKLTHVVDVSSVIDAKRAAMMAHESQIDDDSFFLKLPPEAFVMAFGTEWFRDAEWKRGSAEFRTNLFVDL
jgi:LmbE family N-acetylglucosaminyl deacetylase